MLENINQCEIKVGLFVLRNCDRAPRYKCQQCSKTICGKHSARHEDYAYCVECYAQLPGVRKQLEDDEWWYDDDESYFDELWYYSTRADFHHNVKYVPIDASDYEGFNRQGEQDLYADNDLGSFFDS